MKVILYLAITVSGLIAREDGDSSWTSDADWEQFDKISKEAGNVIIGRLTYERMLKDGEFPLEGRVNIVMTKNPPKDNPYENVEFTNKSPGEILEELRGRGFSSVFVGGGGKLAGSFMKENLIDEIYLTIEPLAFGKGINLFREADFHADLDLLNAERISKNSIQLHYRVVK